MADSIRTLSSWLPLRLRRTNTSTATFKDVKILETHKYFVRPETYVQTLLTLQTFKIFAMKKKFRYHFPQVYRGLFNIGYDAAKDTSPTS